MNSTNLFAHRTTHGFRHFYPSQKAVQMCGPGEIVPVRVIEDEEGIYHGWWDSEQLHHSMIFHSIILLNLCFPNGIKVAEMTGRGKAVRLRVEVRLSELPDQASSLA